MSSESDAQASLSDNGEERDEFDASKSLRERSVY